MAGPGKKPDIAEAIKRGHTKELPSVSCTNARKRKKKQPERGKKKRPQN